MARTLGYGFLAGWGLLLAACGDGSGAASQSAGDELWLLQTRLFSG